MGRCKNDTCVFGALGIKAGTTGSKKTCAICQSEAELRQLSPQAKAALARVISTMQQQEGREEHIAQAYRHIGCVPELLEYVQKVVRENVEKAAGKGVDKDEIARHEGEPPGSVQAPALDRRGFRHLPTEQLDQGEFGWCSFFALAVTTSGALLAKYKLFVEPQRLLDSWLGDAVPDKSAWPDFAARQVSGFKVKKPNRIYEVSVHATTLEDFQTTARLVWRSAGFKLVVLVVNMPSGGNHSVVALRWCEDNSLLCQNSWGGDEPLLTVQKQTFVKAYFVDVSVDRAWGPNGANGSRTDTCQVPEQSLMWKELRP
jgi:hypothetical protein